MILAITLEAALQNQVDEGDRLFSAIKSKVGLTSKQFI